MIKKIKQPIQHQALLRQNNNVCNIYQLNNMTINKINKEQTKIKKILMKGVDKINN